MLLAKARKDIRACGGLAIEELSMERLDSRNTAVLMIPLLQDTVFQFHRIKVDINAIQPLQY